MDIRFPAQFTPEFLEGSFVRGQLPEAMGLKFVEVGENFIRGALTVDQRHLRPGGIANGGVYLTLVETLGSVSACGVIDLERENALGVQVSANHIGTASTGDELTATSRPIHIGRTTQIWEVNIEKAPGKLVSSGRITMMILPRKA